MLSVIIIAEGKTEQLKKCLRSLTPSCSWQLIVVSIGDQLNQEILNEAPASTSLLLHLPTGASRAQARNLALTAATEEWVHFLDEEVRWSRDTFQIALPLLSDPHWDVYGGPELPAREVNALEHALALALSSPLCLGSSFTRFRPLGNKLVKATENKLSSGNIWIRREILIPFTEEFVQSEMSLQLIQLERIGKQIAYHPRLTVTGKRSFSLLGLRRRIFRMGFERSAILRQLKNSGGAAYTVPSLFVLTHFLALLHPSLWYLFKHYFLLILFVSVGLAFRARKPWIFPFVAFFHWFVVWEYGWGFLFERLNAFWKRWSS